VQHGRHGSRVFGQFLALSEAEHHHLEPVVVEQRAAQNAPVRRLNFLRQIAETRVGGRHGDCSLMWRFSVWGPPAVDALDANRLPVNKKGRRTACRGDWRWTFPNDMTGTLWYMPGATTVRPLGTRLAVDRSAEEMPRSGIPDG